MLSARISSFKEVEAEINRRVKALPEAMARVAKKIIIDNSAQGVDIKGQKMVKYTPAYEKFRAKHGLTTDPVNLRASGRLLDNAKVSKQSGLKASLEPSPDRKLIAEGNMRYRKFYPETDSDIVPSFNEKIVAAGEKILSERK